MENKKKQMEITLDQQKLISSPLRAKIIYLLNERAMTAKQVADELRKSNGSIHYHIQQLYNGGIIELVETKDNKGIIEKYYRSKATEFKLKDEFTPEKRNYFMRRGTPLSLSDQELTEFIKEFDALLEKYVENSIKNEEKRTPYEINCEFIKLPNEDEDI